MYVNEIFLSIQGESSFVGFPCVFVRLAGCNLGCRWCDTEYARAPEGSKEMTVPEVVAEVRSYGRRLVEVTGGEPLVQPDTRGLLASLLDEGNRVLLETNGTVTLEGVDPRVVKIIDVKCPSSGFAGSFLLDNLAFINEKDEVKFVIGDREDFDFALDFHARRLKGRTAQVLFAPVTGSLHADLLASWILEEGVDVRLQVQMHRYIWNDARGR